MAKTTTAPSVGASGRTDGASGPALFDLPLVVAPDGGLATPERPTQSLTGLQLAQLVVKAGGAECDVRLLVTDGHPAPPAVATMARLLERDVLVPPPGSELRITRDGSLVPVDRVTGFRVDWLVVPAADPPARQT